MKDFLELLVKDFGLPQFFASWFMLSFYVISFIVIIVKTIKGIIGSRNRKRIKKLVQKDLHPFFTNSEIYNYTKLYIPQYYQNINPSEGEEPGKPHAAAAKSKIMPEFIKKGLLDTSSIKYFIILSDTGMGKTAFLINLFIKYQKIKSKHRKFEIKLFPLGSVQSLDKIKAIQNKSSTILLLDAFDEDIKAVSDYRKRMEEILESVKEFRKIIFTCRTQFFPSRDEEPSDTKDITFGENHKHKIFKLYLSAFDNYDVLRYLFKKYKFNVVKLVRANKLVRKSPSLMFRPMLLTYIDDLIKERFFYNFTYEMYKELINVWIKREASKPAIITKYGVENYSKNLMKFSIELAKNLYSKREIRRGYFITLDDLKKIDEGCYLDTSLLTLEDKTGRSLLNRNSVGQYKFAHKSILEFFLAIEAFENADFYNSFDFHGMDAAKTFHVEMVASFLSTLIGRCQINKEPKLRVLNSILPNYILIIKTLIITNSSSLNFDRLSSLNHVQEITLVDRKYQIIYMLYLFICVKNRSAYPSSNQANKSNFNSLIDEYGNIISQIEDLKPDLRYNELIVIIGNCDIDADTKKLFEEIMDKKDADPLSIPELTILQQIKRSSKLSTSENVILNNGLSDLRKISNLKKHIPETKIYY